MWYVLGFLMCLAFVWVVSVVLVGMGIFPSAYITGERAQHAIIETLRSDPFAGSAVQHIGRVVEGLSAIPILNQVFHILGQLFSITFSPVGLVALGLFWFLLWILP